MTRKSVEGEYSQQEAARRRDATLLRMLKTAPKPHSEMKLGKRGKPKKSLAKRKPKSKLPD
jgi:hypothetical protein